MHLKTLKKKNNTSEILNKIFENLNTLRLVDWTSNLDQNVLVKINEHVTCATNLIFCSVLLFKQLK